VPEIELKKIQPNRLNPRIEFTKAGLDELADSIKQVGLLEPIIVRSKGVEYEVVVGERRYRAAQQAGLDKVSVIIRDYTDDEVMEVNLIENIQREDLSAVEKGKLCRQLLERYPNKYPSQAAIAKKLGITGSDIIVSWLKVASMPPEIQRRIAPETPQRMIPKGKIDYRTATMVARKVKEPQKAIEIIDEIAIRRVPRRTAIQIAKEVAREPQKPVQQIFKEVVEEAPTYLPFSKAHADTILKQIKTQTSRKAKDPRIRPGITVRAQITYFADLEIEDVYRKKLGDFDEDDARREGGYTLDEFKEVWEDIHGEWNPEESVYVIRFRLSKAIGESSNSG